MNLDAAELRSLELSGGMVAFRPQQGLEVGGDVNAVEIAGAELFGVVGGQEEQPRHGRDVDLAAREVPDELLELHHVPAVLRHEIVGAVCDLAEHLERLRVGGFRRVLIGRVLRLHRPDV